MTVSPLKQQFGARLRALILKSPRRQCDLAAALQISNSAISQMLSGKIVPRHHQLRLICNTLELSGDEELELSGMLLNIRNGENCIQSRFNRMFQTACRMRGVSLLQLAGMTGISPARLQLFASCFDAVPKVEEINRLAPVLECSPQDMLLAAGLGSPVSRADGSLAVAEPEAPFLRDSPKLIPVVRLDDFRDYSREQPLIPFAVRHALRQTDRGTVLPVPAAAVLASARKLQLGIYGEVMLLVSEQLPPGFRELELFADKDCRFRVRERKGAGWNLFEMPGTRSSAGNYAVWSLNILEMIVRPVKAGMME